MKKSINSEVKQSWLTSTKAEAECWLHHIDKRRKEVLNIINNRRVPLFEVPEILFNVFAFMNWLAHVDLHENKYVEEEEMIDWLGEMTTWPEEIVEAFWFCLRNPNMHMGRTLIFANHDRKSENKKWKLYADLHPSLDFDPMVFQPKEYKPSNSEDGWLAVKDPENPSKLVVTFYLGGIRRKLDSTLSTVLRHIRNADHNMLMSLRSVNMRVLPFRIYGERNIDTSRVSPDKASRSN